MKSIFFIFFFIPLIGFPQDLVSLEYGATIQIHDLKENLSIIAADALEGRETGMRGQKMAAAFIAENFKELGLKAPAPAEYFQKFSLFGGLEINTEISLDHQLLSKGRDYIILEEMGETAFTFPAVFAGKGNATDLEQVDIQNAGAFFFYDPKSSPKENPVIKSLWEKGAQVIFAVIQSPEEYKQLVRLSRLPGKSKEKSFYSRSSNQNGPLVFIPLSTCEKIFGSTQKDLELAVDRKKLSRIKTMSGEIKVTTREKLIESENVLGFLEGTDKKDEILVITAHYDHIGKKENRSGDQINNGADDDGSGTVAVLALAKAFSLAQQEGYGPRRSILFMAVSGEEKGLLGSQYYTQHPIFPLEKTIVDLNIDMIGRRDPKHKESPPYVYLIGSDKLSKTLHLLSEEVNRNYSHLILDYTYNDQNHPERLYYRSDHWNFAKNNIPIIFYFDGIHEDYHAPSDKVEKIEFDLLLKRTQFIFYLAWEIVNREEKITPDLEK